MDRNRLRAGILILAGTVVLACRFLCPTSTAAYFVGRWGYWAMLLGATIYSIQLYKFVKQRITIAFFRTHWLGWLVSVLGVIMIEVHEPRQFKVLYDEFVFSGIARNMHFLREPTYPIKAHIVQDGLEVYDKTIDKRPLFFPFAVGCLHDLSGYRPENVFILNGIVAFLILFLTYYFGAHYGGVWLGIICQGFWLGLPLLAQCATSGGYDALNVLMLLLFWFFGREYLRTGSTTSQALLILTAVHLAQVRYESVFMLFAMAIIVLTRWFRQRSWTIGWVAAFSPLFLLLPVLINLIFVSTPGFTQTAPGQLYFSIGYLAENAVHAVWYFFSMSFLSTNSPILSAIGVISIIVFFAKMATGLRRLLVDGDEVLLLLTVGVVSFNFLLILCNFWGQIDDPSASRFSLPLHMISILCFAWVISGWKRQKPIPKWLAAFPVFAVVMAVSAEAGTGATRALTQGQAYDWFLMEIAAPAHSRALIISHPVGPIIYNHPAISMEVAEENKWKISECLKQQIYPEILVLEIWSIDCQTGAEIHYNEDKNLNIRKGAFMTDKTAALSSSFKRVKLSEARLLPNMIVRMSRVVGVESADAIPPDSFLKEKPPFEDLMAYNKHIYSILP